MEAEKIAAKAVKQEKALAKLQEKFALSSPEFAKFLKLQAEQQKKITDMWAQVKDALVEAGYFDVIENNDFRISVSKVVGFKVEDIEKLPEAYTETIKVAKTDKIKQHIELYEELPDGVVDNSYYRLNKKIKG